MPSPKMKIVERLEDGSGNAIFISGANVLDKTTGRTLPDIVKSIADSREDLTGIVEEAVSPVSERLNAFLESPQAPDTEINTLSGIVSALSGKSEGDIDISEDSDSIPTWAGKIRLIVSDYTPVETA